MKIIQALLAEHVVFHSLFDHLERLVPGARTAAEVRALAALLEAMMEEHSVVEDQLLIEPLEPYLGHLGQDRNFHAEHEAIDEDLRQLRTATRLPQAKKLFLKAIRFSRKHFDKEERIVFPLAERVLSAKSQELLGKRWRERRTVTT